MSRIILFISVLVLLFLDAFILQKYQKEKAVNDMYINDLSVLTMEKQTYRSNFYNGILNNSLKLEKGLYDALKSYGDLSGDYVFVCRFSELNCERCIKAAVKEIVSYADSIGKENILFLASYSNKLYFDRVPNTYDIGTIEMLNWKTLDIPIESLGFPYYFVLDSFMTIHELFLPQKETPKITQEYLRLINDKYFK